MMRLKIVLTHILNSSSLFYTTLFILYDSCFASHGEIVTLLESREPWMVFVFFQLVTVRS